MSNFRVMLPSGTVCSVVEVCPVAEKVVSFNGERRRFMEAAKNVKRGANGICIYRKTKSDSCGFMSADERWVVIGNLKNEQVQEILKQLNEKGYFDFSQFEYQKVRKDSDIKYGADYLPYTSENNTTGVGLGCFAVSPFQQTGVPTFNNGFCSQGTNIFDSEEQDEAPLEEDNSEDI
jgi:hypothetical protein